MNINFTFLAKYQIPWDGRKSQTIVKGRYVENIDVHRTLQIPLDVVLTASNDNDDDFPTQGAERKVA